MLQLEGKTVAQIEEPRRDNARRAELIVDIVLEMTAWGDSRQMLAAFVEAVLDDPHTGVELDLLEGRA